MPRFLILAVVAVVVLTVYAVIDCAMTDARRSRVLSKPVWLVAILLLPVVGPVCWILFGKGLISIGSGSGSTSADGSRRTARGAAAAAAPDDDEAFLRRLREQAAEERRRQEAAPAAEAAPDADSTDVGASGLEASGAEASADRPGIDPELPAADDADPDAPRADRA